MMMKKFIEPNRTVILLALQLTLILCLPEAGEAQGNYKCFKEGCEEMITFRTEVELQRHNSRVHLKRKHTYGGSSEDGTSSSAPKRQKVGNVGGSSRPATGAGSPSTAPSTSQPAAGAGTSSTAPKRPIAIRPMGPHQKPPPMRPDMNDPLNHTNNSAFNYKWTK